jgi:glycosyltransferase involved in cell wall biosynthesis
VNQNKKISVIVANYNHAQFIVQALDSLVAQTYKNLEVIVVDDKSTDNSLKVVEEWSKNHPGFISLVLPLPENKGKWNALNKGIEKATGVLVTLQDADDVSCSQRIERQMACLELTKTYHNLCGFFHCWTQEQVDENRSYLTPPHLEKNLLHIEPEEVTRMVLLGRKTPGINHYFTANFETHGATCLFYRQLWEHGIKFLPGNMGLRIQLAEDSDFNSKMTLLFQKTSVLLEPLYCYRRNTSTNGAWLEGR